MHDKMLVTYVINLKRSTERMENMDRALKAMQVGVSGFLCLGRLFQGQPNEAALCI